jgi:hypothetical protein
MEAFLLTGSPAKHPVCQREIAAPTVKWYSTILADTNPVTVESHRDTAIGIACMDEAAWHVEVITYESREGVVGVLVGIVGTPVRQGSLLLESQRIGEERGVVALYGKLETIPLTNDVRLHTVAPEDVL